VHVCQQLSCSSLLMSWTHCSCNGLYSRNESINGSINSSSQAKGWMGGGVVQQSKAATPLLLCSVAPPPARDSLCLWGHVAYEGPSFKICKLVSTVSEYSCTPAVKL